MIERAPGENGLCTLYTPDWGRAASGRVLKKRREGSNGLCAGEPQTTYNHRRPCLSGRSRRRRTSRGSERATYAALAPVHAMAFKPARPWRRRLGVCLLSVLLLLLQFGLLARYSLLEVSVPAAAAAAAAADAGPSTIQQILQRAASSSGVHISAASANAASSATSHSAGTTTAAGTAPGNHSSTKSCGQSTTETDFPRNRILIIHEQHLQSMGCDVRLLRFVKDLLYLNQEVSMMFRGSTPSKMRQPKSKQLAAILHIENFEEEQLRHGLRQPPGLYEWTSAERFSQVRPRGSIHEYLPGR